MANFKWINTEEEYIKTLEKKRKCTENDINNIINYQRDINYPILDEHGDVIGLLYDETED